MYTKYVTSHYLLFGVSEKGEVKKKKITILYHTYAVTDFIKQAYFQTDFRGRDLTQSYDKSPYVSRNIERST